MFVYMGDSFTTYKQHIKKIYLKISQNVKIFALISYECCPFFLQQTFNLSIILNVHHYQNFENNSMYSYRQNVPPDFLSKKTDFYKLVL